MNILVTSVGNRDPYSKENNTEGSILTACRKVKPKVVYLLPTKKKHSKQTETNQYADETKIAIKDLFKKTEVIIIPIQPDSPASYTDVQKEFKTALKEIYQKYPPEENDYFTNVSSGTGQMNGVWLILKDNDFLKGKLYQILAPQFVDSGLSPKEKLDARVREIKIDFLEEVNIIDRIKRYMRSFAFSDCIKEIAKLRDITVFGSRKKQAEIFIEVFKVYDAWDHIDYISAEMYTQEALREMGNINDLPEVKRFLEKQKELLKKLKRQQKDAGGPEIFVDLYHYAKRKFEIGEYITVPSIITRIYIGIAEYLLAKENLDYSGLSIEKMEERLFMDFKEWINAFPNSSDDPKYKRFRDIKTLRNSSFTAHGDETINKESAKTNLALIRDFIISIFENEKEIDNYPFTSNLGREYEGILDNILQ